MLGTVVTRDLFRWECACPILVRPSGWGGPGKPTAAPAPPEAQVERPPPPKPPTGVGGGASALGDLPVY